MPIEWSGLGPELLLVLDRRAAEPLRSQLERQLRAAIRSARLAVGERLPSSRELARELGLSRGLVQDCYAQLQAEGYLTTRVGSATRVAAAGVPATAAASAAAGVPLATRSLPAAGAQAATRTPATLVPPAAGALPAAATPAGTRTPSAGTRTPSAHSGQPTRQRLRVDFASGVPDLASFPRSDWVWALREACRAAPNAAFHYGDPRGSLELREVLAAYLRRVRAAVADSERVVICTGFAQGLNLVLRALARSGVRQVAFEDPGYTRTVAAAAAGAAVQAIPVPVDESGIVVDALARTGARACVLTPAHQWPTGVVLTPQRRLQLVAWAASRDATIIEDDYDAEFRYDREPVGAMQGLAADRVAALGTVSKSLAPALRLGWILSPPALAQAVADEKGLHDRGSPVLDQLALATLIESGRYDRHLRRMRTVYARRRNTLVDALAEQAPGITVTGLAAGFHAVAHLPAPLTERAVVSAAWARSIGLYGMSINRSTGETAPEQLVLGFGNLSERAIQAGISEIADLLTPAKPPP
jgi:GntR family transcriptional regulator / MocR family aminotransferase